MSNLATGITIKGLGHIIQGSLSTYRMVTDVTNISQYRLKTVETLKRNTEKPKKGTVGQNWRR